jgi:tripartite-type tricarboxylate transporter receptor subunit TctC
MGSNKSIRLKLAGALLISFAGAAVAQSPTKFPTRQVRIVVNSQAGGTVDVVGRMLGEELQRLWSQTVIVEDVIGAAGNTGASVVARAEPDGHTLLLSHPGPLTVNPLMFKSMNYDPAKLVAITNPLSLANVLAVSNALNVGSVRELTEYGRKNPGKLTYGSQGIGTTPHLTASLFGARLGLDLVHVPYRGSPAAILDLAAGRLDMMFDNVGTAAPQHESGQTKIIAVADDKRLPRLPDVPTMAEAGVPNFRSVTWFGLMAPEGTPSAIVEKINADAVAVLRRPEFAARLRALHLEPIANSPEEAKRFIASETLIWSAVIRDAKIAPE